MSGALVGTFGASDEATLDVVFGKHKPVGKLPFELPSSMAEVEVQLETCPMIRPIRSSRLVGSKLRRVA